MSMQDFISLDDDDNVSVNTGASHELDVTQIEQEARRLLGSDADEAGSHTEPPADSTADSPADLSGSEPEPALTSPSGAGQGEGVLAVSSPPTDDDGEPTPALTVPTTAPEESDEGGFVVVEPDELDAAAAAATAPASSPTPSAYDYNVMLETYYGQRPEPATVANVFDTWDRLNRLPADQQQAINEMLAGTYNPARYAPPAAAPAAPSTPPTPDAWADPYDPATPAPASLPSVSPDPAVEELRQQMAQLQLQQYQQVRSEIVAGAEAAMSELPDRYSFLTPEMIDTIQIAVNRESDSLFTAHAQGYNPKDAWLQIADNVVRSTPVLFDKYLESEVARRTAPVAQATQRAANAAKIAGGSSAAATSPLTRGESPSTPALPAKASNADVAAAVAAELRKSSNVQVGDVANQGL